MDTWALPEIDLARCTRCGRCVTCCPGQAVDMRPAGPAIVRPGDCTYCTLCEAVCPPGAITCAYELIWETEV